jgi:transcriptional regulator with XRE-family HTH domain
LSIPKVSVSQIKAARMLLGWPQSNLATRSGVSEPTIKRLEAVDGPLGGREETGAKIVGALTRAHIEFLDDNNGGGPQAHRDERKPIMSKLASRVLFGIILVAAAIFIWWITTHWPAIQGAR